VSVWVIPTDEERMIAQHTLALLRPPGPVADVRGMLTAGPLQDE
jgi:hypothetical protein